MARHRLEKKHDAWEGAAETRSDTTEDQKAGDQSRWHQMSVGWMLTGILSDWKGSRFQGARCDDDDIERRFLGQWRDSTEGAQRMKDAGNVIRAE